MNLRHLKLVFLELLDKLGGVQLAVASSSFDNLCLLVQCEVLPGEVWTNVLLEQAEHLIMGDRTGVGEVVDAGILVLGHEDRSWEKVVQDGVRVGNINDTLVFGDLGDKVTGVQVVANGHAKSKDEDIGIRLHDLIDH